MVDAFLEADLSIEPYETEGFLGDQVAGVKKKISAEL